MNSITKMLLPGREQHNVDRQLHRQRRDRQRRKPGDHDVAGEVDARGLEHALSTQVVGDVRRDDAVSGMSLNEEAEALLITSLPLPDLLSFLSTAMSSPLCWLISTASIRTPRNCRERSTIGKIVRDPAGTDGRARDRARRSGRRL